MGAGRDAGAALRAVLPTFGSAVGAGADALMNGVSTANGVNPAAMPLGAAGARGTLDFLTGLATGRPTISSVGQVVDAPVGHAINYMLPAATPAPKAVPVVAAAAPAKGGVAAKADPAADPYGAFSKLSFRQLSALGAVAGETRPLGSAMRQPTAADAAGNLLMQMTLPTFQNMLKGAKDDPERSKIIENYRDQTLLPIISHGNPMAGMIDPSGS